MQHRDADYIITHSGKDTEPGKVFRIASKEEEGTGDGKAGKGQIMFSTHTQNTHAFLFCTWENFIRSPNDLLIVFVCVCVCVCVCV